LDFSSLVTLIGYLITGLVSGTLGGLIGIGGGVIVVPALTLIFGKDAQLAVAASLFQMIFVATSSTYGHWKNRYIIRSVVVRLVPLATVCAVAGTIIGSSVGGATLLKVFALFLVYTSADVGYKVAAGWLKGHPEEVPLTEYTPTNRWTIPAVAVPMGLACGVLGIGGGSIAVPSLHKFLKLPLKNAIANSSAAIFFLSIVAAISKTLLINGKTVTLFDGTYLTLHWYDVLIVGGLLAPTSFVGGRLGAHLARRAPTRIIQGIFILVMLYSARDMWLKSEAKPKPPVVSPPAVEAPANPGSQAAQPTAPGD